MILVLFVNIKNPLNIVHYYSIRIHVILGVCASLICENSAVCIDINGEPFCDCLDGYKGERCENGEKRNSFSCLASFHISSTKRNS